MAMTEADFLKYIQGKSREQKQAPGPTKGQKPKVTRMVSKRQATVLKATPNPFRASYQTADQAKRGCIVGEPEIATREVGPGDRYNKTNDYTMGKDTAPRNGDGR
jgi:hypothetical protein